jgi:hypothetical protein
MTKLPKTNEDREWAKRQRTRILTENAGSLLPIAVPP